MTHKLPSLAAVAPSHRARRHTFAALVFPPRTADRGHRTRHSVRGVSLVEYGMLLALFVIIFIVAAPRLSLTSGGAACKAGGAMDKMITAPGTSDAVLTGLIGSTKYGKSASSGQYCCGVEWFPGSPTVNCLP